MARSMAVSVQADMVLKEELRVRHPAAHTRPQSLSPQWHTASNKTIPLNSAISLSLWGLISFKPPQLQTKNNLSSSNKLFAQGLHSVTWKTGIKDYLRQMKVTLILIPTNKVLDTPVHLLAFPHMTVLIWDVQGRAAAMRFSIHLLSGPWQMKLARPGQRSPSSIQLSLLLSSNCLSSVVLC